MACSTPALSDEKSAPLWKLFGVYDEWQKRENPSFAVSRGDYRFADRLADSSLEAIERRHREQREFLVQLHAINVEDLGDEDRLNYRLFERELKNAIEGHRFRVFLAPIGGRFGPQQEIPQLHERVNFNNVKDYENYLGRLGQVPKLVSDTIEKLKRGVEEDRVPAKITVAGLPGQFDALLSKGLDALAEPFDQWPDSIAESDRTALRERFDKTALPAIRKAGEQLRDYFVAKYLPACREGIAATEWPDGEAYYAHQLRTMTTTDMSAREIHETGLNEVARIRGEMMRVIRLSDFLEKFPDAAALDDDALFQRFVDYLRTDARFYYTDPDELLAGYRDICKRIDPQLPSLFGRLPRLPYGVREIPAFMAPNQTTAYYQHGSLENGQAGYFYANIYALDQRPKYEMAALAAHEAVPGHHLQIAIAQELEDVPEFRKNMWITAYGEGWALYSERLGIPMGLYEDPYDDFGRLLYEIWRACRLVVDPGMHALGWSRQQAIDFMLENTALSKLNITTEVDRYIAWPGQACGYKIGELKIRELRGLAERELADRFDIRGFHDVVLTSGPVPLDILESRVQAWINARKAE
jgi:uncharacterized protein (DUF885 family)